MKKYLLKLLSVVSVLTLFLNNAVFATSKTSQDVLKDIESLDYNNLNAETLIYNNFYYNIMLFIYTIYEKDTSTYMESIYTIL